VGHLLQGQVQCLHVLPASQVFSFKMAANVAFLHILWVTHFCKFLPTATILKTIRIASTNRGNNQGIPQHSLQIR
jgi:hypothetical protein